MARVSALQCSIIVGEQHNAGVATHLGPEGLLGRREFVVLCNGALQTATCIVSRLGSSLWHRGMQWCVTAQDSAPVRGSEARGDLPLVTHEEVAVGSRKGKGTQEVDLVERGQETPDLQCTRRSHRSEWGHVEMPG